MARKEKAYISDSRGSSRRARHTFKERRQAIGPSLSFGAAEAYKLLRTNVMFSMSDEAQCKIIGVTSSLRGEGKSTTSVNFAYTLSESNKNVLLIEADMRIPVMANLFELNQTAGLSNVLAGLSNINDVLMKTPIGTHLYILPAGEIPPNPSELISSRRMEMLVSSLSKSFDYIVIDLPPVNAVSDSLAVSKLLTGMVVVVRQDYCDRYALAEAMRQLSFLNVKVLGFVVNDAYGEGGHYGKYYRSKGNYYKKDYYTKGYGESANNAAKGG